MWFEIFSIVFGSGGILYGVVSWFFSKRERNNDFIAKLQVTIDKLTDSYTNVLTRQVEIEGQNTELLIKLNKIERQNRELLETLERTELQNIELIDNQVKLEKQNAELLVNQEELKNEVEKLRGENKKLLAKINELNKMLKHEKFTNPTHSDNADKLQPEIPATASAGEIDGIDTGAAGSGVGTR